MSNTLKTIWISFIIASCSNVNSNSQIPVTDTIAGVNIEQEPVNSSKVSLNKITFQKITFGGDIKQWNSYAAGYASKVQGVSLSEVNKEYHIKLSIKDYTYHMIPEFSGFIRRDKKGNIYNYQINGNSTDQFLSSVSYNYPATSDEELINLFIQIYMEDYNLKYKYGYEDIYVSMPKYDPNDPFLGINEDFNDKMDKIENSAGTWSTDNDNNTGSYSGKKRNSSSTKRALFENESFYFGFESTTNSSYTVDKVGDKYNVKDNYSTFLLTVKVFPKSYALPDIFENYATPSQRQQKNEEENTKRLIDKAKHN
jgi:hypothetical protein